jgi:hypothetical protein
MWRHSVPGNAAVLILDCGDGHVDTEMKTELLASLIAEPFYSEVGKSVSKPLFGSVSVYGCICAMHICLCMAVTARCISFSLSLSVSVCLRPSLSTAGFFAVLPCARAI